MAEHEVQPQPEIPKPRRLRLPERSVLIALTAFALSLTFVVFQVVQNRKLQSRIQELEWSEEIRGQDAYMDEVDPSVGTIQFLGRGYTIEFTKVDYAPGGLVLHGFIGNPTQIWISTLTLDFTAYEPRSSQRIKFFQEQDHGFFIFSVHTIGRAQAETIDILSPGGRQPFRVTIPNVRQTADGLQLTVVFSGERYAYGS